MLQTQWLWRVPADTAVVRASGARVGAHQYYGSETHATHGVSEGSTNTSRWENTELGRLETFAENAGHLKLANS